MQHEDERNMEVMINNMILLRHLTEISNSKRIDDGAAGKSRQRMSWKGYYDTILNMRRLQLEEMRQMLLNEVNNPAPPTQGEEAGKQNAGKSTRKVDMHL